MVLLDSGRGSVSIRTKALSLLRFQRYLRIEGQSKTYIKRRKKYTPKRREITTNVNMKNESGPLFGDPTKENLRLARLEHAVVSQAILKHILRPR